MKGRGRREGDTDGEREGEGEKWQTYMQADKEDSV